MPNHQIQAELPFKQSHAFLIGIDKYQHISHLKTAERDARLIGHQLEKHHGFQTHYLMGEAATLAGIRKLLHETIPELANETGDGPNRIILYFACHGYAKDSDHKPQGFIAPWDAEKEGFEKLLPMEEVHDALREEKINCRHGLLILDCCFAGAFKWSNNSRHGGFALPKTIHHSLFLQFTTDPAWQVITSSSSDQEAADLINHLSLGHRDSEKWKDSPFVQTFNWQDFADEENRPIDISLHSPFALALFIALQGDGDRIMKGGRGDGVITSREIHGYLRHWVELVTMSQQRRQTPLIIDLPRHDKGEFVFLHPKHPAFLSPDPGRNPYKGLQPFEEADEKFFFGRDKVIEHIIKLLNEQTLITLTGPAGSGKTSLIHAGVIPLIRHKGWTILPNIPHAIGSLETQLQALSEDSPCLLIIDDFEQLLATSVVGIEHWELYLLKLLIRFPKLKIVLLVRTDFELYYSSTKSSTIENEVYQNWWRLWENSKYRLPPLSKKELRDIIVSPARQAVLFFETDALVNELVNNVYLAPGALPLLSYFLKILFDNYKKSLRTDRTLSQKDVDQIGGLIGALQKRANDTYNAMPRPEQMMMRFLLMRMVKLENGLLTRRKVPFINLDQIPTHWIKDEDNHIWYHYEAGEKTNIYHELDFPNDFNDKLLHEVIKRLDKDEKLVVITKDEKTEQLYIEPIHDALITFWPLAREWFQEVGTDTILLQRQLWQSVIDHNQLQDEAIVFIPVQRDISEDVENATLLWDNNPKLLQVTGALLDSIRREDGQENRLMESIQLIPDAEIKNLSPENQKIYDNLRNMYMLRVGDGKSSNDVKILSTLSKLNAFWAEVIVSSHLHWLNQAEAKFVIESWQKKDTTIKNLIKQRDEAQALAQEAQAAALAAKGQMLRENNPTLGLHYAYAGYVSLPNEETIGALNSLTSAGPYFEDIISTNTTPKQRGHITTLASSPTSPNLILCGSSSGAATLWDISTGKCIQAFDDNKDRNIQVVESPDGRFAEIGGNHGIISVDFSTDGKLVLTGCNDGSTVIWDVMTGNKKAKIQAPIGEEKYLGGIGIQDISHIKVDYPQEKPNYTFAHFLDDSNTILTISPFGVMQEWNLEEQSEIRHYTFPASRPIDQQSTVICTAISKNGRYVALGLKQTRGIFADNSSIIIIDREKPEQISRVVLRSTPVAGKLFPCCLRFDTAAYVLYAGLSDGCVKAYTVRSGKERLNIRAFTKPVRSILLTKKDRYLYTGGEDYDVKIWNARTGYIRGTLRGRFKGINTLVSVQKEAYIAHGYLDKILLWQQDQQASQVASSFEVGTTDPFLQKLRPAKQLMLSPNKQTIVGVHFDSGIPYYKFHQLDGQAKQAKIISNLGLEATSFSPDGQYFIARHAYSNGIHKDDENNSHLYDLKSTKNSIDPSYLSILSNNVIEAIAISNNASFLLIASQKKYFELVYLHDADKKPLKNPYKDTQEAKEIILNSSQNQFLLLANNTIQLWDILEDKLKIFMTYYPRNKSVPVCIAFGRLGKYIYAGYSDFTIKQWEISPKKEDENDSFPIHSYPTNTFSGHSEAVVSIAISNDNKYLLSGSDDGSIRLWDIQRGLTLQTIPPYREPLSPEQEEALEDSYERDNLNPIQLIHFVGFINNDRQLIAGYKNGTVRSYYNILYQWPQSCYQLPKKSRSRLKIPEDIKFPK